jgi:uncharacterized membrane protein
MEQNTQTQTVQQPSQGQKADKWLAPVNRTPLSLIAGYAALFSVLIIPAPIALGLGIWALIDLKKKPNMWGKGRAWFAVIAGGLFTLVFIAVLIGLIKNSTNK